jgi:hypothetical protein
MSTKTESLLLYRIYGNEAGWRSRTLSSILFFHISIYFNPMEVIDRETVLTAAHGHEKSSPIKQLRSVFDMSAVSFS